MNDVCLRQMMLASPMMTATPNDVWLRHILGQTSHHCDQREQHHFERGEKHHIAVGDASFDKIEQDGGEGKSRFYTGEPFFRCFQMRLEKNLKKCKKGLAF
ncbi:MAG: hypothetical protein IJA78_04360 [Clostridia bacterium]|nr:hypothetical protein [Clostridia bacterium]